MLEVRGLTIAARGRNLVRDLSFALPDRGITALIGPSGCGKTSVLRWLAGILGNGQGGLRARGRLLLDGAPAAAPHPALSYQPQGDALFPWLTIAQNAALGLTVAGLPRGKAMARAAALFAPFGLAGCETLFPAQVSGGMRQRAAFLRTIVQDSRFALLDEPFSALDAVTRLAMQDWLLARLRDRPRGVLLVTHDLHEATGLADRILVMAAGPGRIVADIPVPIPRDRRTEAAMAPLRQSLKSLLLKELPR
ncbi:ABC transporter ATP-binding protein [Paracoccus sediminis]|uniref:ABC transporter ATP-binding protein n=1 Tax=Paracoccus sediminis TaxID=1214787 RepID=A0A238WQ64_9RHOB|nr:ABC transporter ATP-binding protein [Paracoccus sediminis]TBN50392.1 ABC transporter ATP-binding protein [Paracoccus sediminis]SNR48696.1 NitT/TauT family transport system ATP-binding protein [Paracoccus sediminis]